MLVRGGGRREIERVGGLKGGEGSSHGSRRRGREEVGRVKDVISFFFSPGMLNLSQMKNRPMILIGG